MTTPHSSEHETFVVEENRRVKIEGAISRTLDASKIKHQGERADAVRAIVKKLQEVPGTEFRISDRNWLVATRNGHPLNLQAEVDNVLLTDRSIGDANSVQAAVAAGELDVRAKSDLSTAAQKSAFLAKFGYSAWARLPQQRQVEVTEDMLDSLAASQLKNLPLKMKVKLTEKQISDALRRR